MLVAVLTEGWSRSWHDSEPDPLDGRLRLMEDATPPDLASARGTRPQRHEQLDEVAEEWAPRWLIRSTANLCSSAMNPIIEKLQTTTNTLLGGVLSSLSWKLTYCRRGCFNHAVIPTPVETNSTIPIELTGNPGAR